MKLRIGSRNQWLVLLMLVMSGLIVCLARQDLSHEPKYTEYTYGGAIINGCGLAIDQDIPSDLKYEPLEIITPYQGRYFSCANNRCTFTIRRGDDGTVVNDRIETAITNAIKSKRVLYVAATSGGYVIQQSIRPEQQ